MAGARLPEVTDDVEAEVGNRDVPGGPREEQGNAEMG